MQVAIYGRSVSEGSQEYIHELYRNFSGLVNSLFIFEPFYRKTKAFVPAGISVKTFKTPAELVSEASALITIGGDGTLLEAITFIGDSGIPVIGINTGRLGFLAGFSKEEIPLAVKLLLNNELSFDSRGLLEVSADSGPFKEFPFALNEATIHKKDNSSMITLQVHRNGIPLNTYWADGLIISTPTGSTGYSLSCGGPIMMPDSANFILTPIAPHNLNVRPLVISDADILTISSEVRGSHVMLSLDSRSTSFDAKEKITIKKADFKLKLGRKPTQNFLETLREKLMWGYDKRN
jgi:NAD+ kinase